MSSDTASTIIAKPAADVFRFMSDPARLDLWSFGTWNIKLDADGLVQGTAMHDGRSICVRIEAHEENFLIDYHVGPSASELVPRIFSRIVPGHHFSQSSEQCMLIMVAVRGDTMDDERWQSLKSIHTVEVGLIKSLIESGHDHRNK